MSGSGERRFDVTGLQVVASVLATVTGAIAASYLGVAGTMIGAAVMSVASTAGSSIYKHYLGRTAGRLKEAAPVAAAHRAAERMTTGTRPMPHRPRAGLATGEPGDAETTQPDLTRLDQTAPVTGRPSPPETGTGEPQSGEHDTGDQARGGWFRWLRGRPAWAAVALASLGVFAAVVGGITAFEAAEGKPLDNVVWHHKGSGTSVGGLFGGQPAPATKPASRTATPHRTASTTPSPSTSPSGTGSSSPSPAPSSGSPSPTGSSSPSPTPTSPTSTPTVGSTKNASP